MPSKPYKTNKISKTPRSPAQLAADQKNSERMRGNKLHAAVSQKTPSEDNQLKPRATGDSFGSTFSTSTGFDGPTMQVAPKKDKHAWIAWLLGLFWVATHPYP